LRLNILRSTKSAFLIPKRYDEYPRPFYMGVPPPGVWGPSFPIHHMIFRLAPLLGEEHDILRELERAITNRSLEVLVPANKTQASVSDPNHILLFLSKEFLENPKTVIIFFRNASHSTVVSAHLSKFGRSRPWERGWVIGDVTCCGSPR